MNEEIKRKIYQGAQIHGFAPKEDERQKIIYEFADYLVENWEEL